MQPITMYGADWCPDCRRVKAFLTDHGIPFEFIEIDKHEWAAQKVEELNQGKRRIPTLILDDAVLSNPDNVTLRQALQIEDAEAQTVYDVAVVGAGAAGLTTAIYTQRERYATVILEKQNIGGNAFLTKQIENYPGFTNISGPDLMQKMADQAQQYGAVIKQGVDVTAIAKRRGVFELDSNLGRFRAKTVVLAVGSTYRRLHIPGEEALIGGGIHFCATCDGPFYRDREILVIGGGNSALEEGIFLSEFCRRVTFVARSPEFSASKTYVDKLRDRPNIAAYMNQESVEFLADDRGLFNALKVRDRATGEERLLQADGAFVFIGLRPNTAFLTGIVDLDERGFVVTEPGAVQTSVPGILAAGDCRKGAIAQVAAATGEGVVASFAVKAYLHSPEMQQVVS